MKKISQGKVVEVMETVWKEIKKVSQGKVVEVMETVGPKSKVNSGFLFLSLSKVNSRVNRFCFLFFINHYSARPVLSNFLFLFLNISLQCEACVAKIRIRTRQWLWIMEMDTKENTSKNYINQYLQHGRDKMNGFSTKTFP